ncbi:MAG: sigma-70 family RNA polymerase sigma factor [Flavobacteriales bacterium]|nr:sigma-70 family RNA polymerase sigma factor [Flavobacteriales bacterium]
MGEERPIRATPVNEHEAIALAARGDHHAFAWIIGEYKHMVHTASYRILRHREEAEEATQDTFVKAYQNLGGYQGGSKFSTWLFSIAYRTAISQLRKRREATGSIDDLGAHEPTERETLAVEAGDRTAALTKALAQLPEEDAAIVSFYYLEEMNVEEIVTVTGLGASNVKVKLHRCRKRLLEILQHELKEEAWTLIAD